MVKPALRKAAESPHRSEFYDELNATSDILLFQPQRRPRGVKGGPSESPGDELARLVEGLGRTGSKVTRPHRIGCLGNWALGFFPARAGELAMVGGSSSRIRRALRYIARGIGTCGASQPARV